MTASHLTADGEQEKYEEIFCSLELTRGIQSQLIFLLVLNTILSITAFLGNTLILLALKKVTSLHRPSKLLYRNLAATDLCVGVIVAPVGVIYLIAVAVAVGHQLGQASSAVVEAQIQTTGNFKQGLSNCNCVMDCARCLYNNARMEFPSNHMVQLYTDITVPSLIDCFFCENFSCSPSSTNSRAESISPRTV